MRLRLDPPLAGALVVLRDPNTGRIESHCVTNQEGYCELRARAGTYELWIAHPDFKGYKDTIDVTGDIALSVKLVSAIKYGYGLPLDVSLSLNQLRLTYEIEVSQ